MCKLDAYIRQDIYFYQVLLLSDETDFKFYMSYFS